MGTRVAVATIIAGMLFAAHTLWSGAPMRVHVVTAVGLLVAFCVPALFVGRPKDAVQPWPVLALTCLGVLALVVGEMLAVSKTEILDGVVLFVVGAPAVIALLLFHGVLVHRMSRRGTV
jgi:hypothetical protein